jgi:hypothetical protein
MGRKSLAVVDTAEAFSDAPEARQRELAHVLTLEDKYGAFTRAAIRRAWPWVDKLPEAELDRLDHELDFAGEDLARGLDEPRNRRQGRPPKDSRG